MQAWLCFSLDDCHLPPVSAPVSSRHLDSLVHGPGLRHPAPCGKWCASEKMRFCGTFPPVSLSRWVPGKDFAFGWFLLQSHSRPLLHLTPVFLSELVPASTARFCGGKRRGRTYVVPLGSQVSRGRQTVLHGTEARSLFWKLGPTTWLQGGKAK